MNIVTSSTFLKSKPSRMSLLETECLFGESVEVMEEKSDWVYSKLTTDNYYGWINKKNLGVLREASHRVISIRTFIYRKNNPKSDVMLYLPMGSKLAIDKIEGDWGKTYFLFNNKMVHGYVPSHDIVQINEKLKDWVKKAQELEGTPYKWGGRDTMGIDCSALLQLSYQTYGQDIPRNTSDQVKLIKPIIKKINHLKRGCIIFWEGHVAIMIDKVNCIHANAYHMKTVTEPLIDVINRMDAEHPIVKMMDFN